MEKKERKGGKEKENEKQNERKRMNGNIKIKKN